MQLITGDCLGSRHWLCDRARPPSLGPGPSSIVFSHPVAVVVVDRRKAGHFDALLEMCVGYLESESLTKRTRTPYRKDVIGRLHIRRGLTRDNRRQRLNNRGSFLRVLPNLPITPIAPEPLGCRIRNPHGRLDARCCAPRYTFRAIVYRRHMMYYLLLISYVIRPRT